MLLDLSGVSLWLLVLAVIVSAAVITVAGSKLSTLADQVADSTGIGEALAGAVLLGATTSLPGIIVSVVSAGFGFPELAISNAIGGIAAQTAFLAIADIAYRKANLEHAAASMPNLVQGALLITLLGIPIIGMSSPPITILAVSPATIGMVALYVYGLRMVARARAEPMWRPKRTSETFQDVPDTEQEAMRTRTLVPALALCIVLTATAGYALAESAVALSERTGVSQTAVGALLTAVVTSLPELVTSIAAVRAGALTLAVGGIIGGNSFDVLFLAMADVAYRDGSIYEQFNSQNVFVMSLTIVMSGVLLMGLLRREEQGPGGIGFESTLVLALYALSVALIVYAG